MTKKNATSNDAKFVQELADILKDANLVEIEYETEAVSIRLSKATSAIAPMAQPSTIQVAPQSNASPAPSHDVQPTESISSAKDAVTSPMVGTVYLAPEPGADNFINIGDKVSTGQTLLIIEAMKVMNPITAPEGGIIKAILVSNAQPVEFGEALVIIE